MGNDGNRSSRRRVAADKHSPNGTSVLVEKPVPEIVSLKRSLAERLIGTRAEFQEALTCYSVRVHGTLAQICDVLLEPEGSLGDAEARAREQTLRRALEHLENLELKPSKGRRRDLKAVEVLAKDLATETADW